MSPAIPLPGLARPFSLSSREKRKRIWVRTVPGLAGCARDAYLPLGAIDKRMSSTGHSQTCAADPLQHDQPAFRQALWRARQGALSLKEHILSPTEHCRNCAPRNQYKCSWSSTAPLLLTASVRTNMEASLTASAADGADPDELLAEGSTCLVLHGKACGWRTVPPKAVPVSSRERAAGAA
eukprot:scaffold1449_cov324-Prasinococcus_capsulatus_cf.AAC.7